MSFFYDIILMNITNLLPLAKQQKQDELNTSDMSQQLS